MKTWKKSAIGVFNGKRFSIQMLVNKLKKLVIFSKKIKKKTLMLLWFSTIILCLKLTHKNTEELPWYEISI